MSLVDWFPRVYRISPADMAKASATLPETEPVPIYALSIKQPWATLVVHGLKTVEVRRWPASLRGRIYIHAGRIADSRPEGWGTLPASLKSATELRGGLLGTIELTECIAYRTAAAFNRDWEAHRNDPTWYRPPVLYGFRLREPRVIAFRSLPGQVKFFRVERASNAR